MSAIANETMCLSPQDKMRSCGSLNVMHRKKQFVRSKESLDDSIQQDDTEIMEDIASEWICDESVLGAGFDEGFNQDIDWVRHDDVETSLNTMNNQSETDVTDCMLYFSPLRPISVLDESIETNISVLGRFPTSVEANRAEKLLMRFETMHFSIPSPNNSKSANKTANEKACHVSSSWNAAQCNAQEDRQQESASFHSEFTIAVRQDLQGTDTNASSKRIGSYTPEARKLRIHKFHEKRKNRTWKKSIKYDCRKKLADDRPRIKGRFVRVIENQDETNTCSGENSLGLMMMSVGMQSHSNVNVESSPSATDSLFYSLDDCAKTSTVNHLSSNFLIGEA